jgi:hypothetical protein
VQSPEVCVWLTFLLLGAATKLLTHLNSDSMHWPGSSQQANKALTSFPQSPLSFASQSLESDFLAAQRESFNRRCRLFMVVVGSAMTAAWIRTLSSQNQNVVFQAWNAVYLLAMALCLLLLHRSSKSDICKWTGATTAMNLLGCVQATAVHPLKVPSLGLI